MIYSDDIYQKVTRTNGVTGFVGPGGHPHALSDEEVRRMGLEEKADKIDFIVGDYVQIISGTLESFAGEVVAMEFNTQKAKVIVEMFGRATEVEVDFVQVKKIDKVVTETPEI